MIIRFNRNELLFVSNNFSVEKKNNKESDHKAESMPVQNFDFALYF